jgi:hypothetical protein
MCDMKKSIALVFLIRINFEFKSAISENPKNTIHLVLTKQ